MKKVIILLSTYNGSQYLEEQLNSLVNQSYPNLYVLVRDDGSKDRTIEILEKYSQKYSMFDYYIGKNVGSAESFMNLVFNSGEYDFYAFCDQDDVWLNDKIETGINAIEKCDGPALYHGLAGYVDSKLNPLPNKCYKPKNDFGGSLISSATGCTMVFNKKLMELVREYRPVHGHISMHDAWIYRIAYAVNAEVIYDPSSHIKYRQHGNNVSGGAKMTIKDKFKRAYFTNVGLRSNVAQELLNGYCCRMSKKNIYLADLLANYKRNFTKKIKLLFSTEITTNHMKTNIQNKILILFNRM